MVQPAPADRAVLERESARLAARPAPPPISARPVVRALFVPQVRKGLPRRIGDVHIVTLSEML